MLYTAGGGDLLPTEKEVWFVPEPVWILWREEKTLYCAENRIRFFGFLGDRPITIATELPDLAIIICTTRFNTNKADNVFIT